MHPKTGEVWVSFGLPTHTCAPRHRVCSGCVCGDTYAAGMEEQTSLLGPVGSWSTAGLQCKRRSQGGKPSNPALVAVLRRSAMPGEALACDDPAARASCIQGACTGEANQFCKLFQRARLGQPRFTVMLLWSGRTSAKLHSLEGLH